MSTGQGNSVWRETICSSNPPQLLAHPANGTMMTMTYLPTALWSAAFSRCTQRQLVNHGCGRWPSGITKIVRPRSEEHTSELQSHSDLVCRLLLEKKTFIATPMTIVKKHPHSSYCSKIQLMLL